ncbi:hypothetical protein GDO78_005411 [Eleutherodactylus coqui]|uniref:Uncharacterized protein n=1 Tax=Eleutherodactylus coqui TaxID=57060 RepID=A0A8J6FKA4_ELECQ|nr:hypothetical protein GDO78_005411 [Eleutherodactylus coqui]
MSKKPWGTILPAPFPLGHQILSNKETEQLIERLHSSKQCTSCGTTNPLQQSRATKALTAGCLSQLLQRLTQHSEKKAADSKRVAHGKILQMGIVNSYAWKGWN